MSVWKGQVHDIKVYNDSLLLLATDNGLAVMNEHTHVISRTFEECIPSGLLANRRLMSLYKDKQGSLWLGTFNEGALFYTISIPLSPADFEYKSADTGDRKTNRGAGEIMDRT